MGFSKDCLLKVYDEKNYLANVLVPLSYRFKRVVFFSRKRANEKRYQAIRKLLERHQIKMEFVIVQKEKIIDEYLNQNPAAVIDVSGNKYLGLYLFEKSITSKRAILYYDDQENVIKDYRSHRALADEVYHLGIRDIIALSGADFESNMHKLPRKADFSTIKALMQEMKEHYPSFTHLIGSLAQVIAKEEDDKIYLDPKRQSAFKSDISFSLLEKYGILAIENNCLIIKKESFRPLLINAGAWLEAYLYIICKESGLFEEGAMSVVIDFRGSDKKYPITCEIDLILLKNNRLLLVSCKSNKVDAASVNEICLHNYVLGNNLSTAMIATMEDLNVKNPTIYQKARELAVAVLDVPRLMQKDAPQVIMTCLMGEYKYEGVRS